MDWLRRLVGAAGHRRARDGAVREVEAALRRLQPPRTDRRAATRLRWRERAEQLKRIVVLEEIILHRLPDSPSGVSTLGPAQRAEVVASVDAAVDLARQRVLLLRAVVANPLQDVKEELEGLRRLHARLSAVEDRRHAFVGEIDRLTALSREFVARIERWQEDLLLAELQLDQIEMVLRQVAYDPGVTTHDVGQRLLRLEGDLRARRVAVQELEGQLGAGAGRG